MANSVLCVKCDKWIHGRCAKVQRVTLRLGRDFVCGRCKKQANGLVGLVEELCEEVETVKSFCYLGDRVNASGACEAAVTARARIGWVKFKVCGEFSKRFSLKMKGMIYRSCVRSAMLYGSKTWCLRENEMAILRGTESHGESNVWCQTDGEKEDRGPNGDVGIKGNSGSDGKSEWSEMVRACVKEG